MKGKPQVGEITSNAGKNATTHRVETAHDNDDVLFIAEGAEYTKVAIYKRNRAGDQTDMLETWISREVWQALCHKLGNHPAKGKKNG